MKCEVLRQFRIATDSMGIYSKELNVGDTYDVPEAMVPSLVAEGYIKFGESDPAPVVAPTPSAEPGNPAPPAGLDGSNVVEIPENWSDLPWAELKALASEFTTEKVKTKDDAVAAVEAEIAKRAAAQQSAE